MIDLSQAKDLIDSAYEAADGNVELAMLNFAKAQALAAVAQAEALQRIARCVVPLNNGEVALNMYDVSRQDV